MKKQLQFIMIVALTLTASTTLSGQSQSDLSQYILTPKAPKSPQINCAKVFGARPGSDFQFLIATTGQRPISFSAQDLPKGLKLNSETGLITGRLKKRGEYKVLLRAQNQYGQDKRTLTIKIGDEIALTPPMGWNSWNCWGSSVSEARVLSSARAMVEKDLINYGWTYINIDDGWQSIRGGKYNAIQPNNKFPNIKALSDTIHSLGLKMGIYSTAWVITFAGHIGSTCPNADGTYPWINVGNYNDIYRISTPEDPSGEKVSWQHHYYGQYSFVLNDVRQWQDWRVDYLKYDWYPNDYYHVKEMHDALQTIDRDIVFSLSGISLYANAPVWAKYTNCYRTTPDIIDLWSSVLNIGFKSQIRWTGFNRPGHWADADMLVVGKVGWNGTLRSTRLTPDEQFTHISLWALLSNPMLIGCDMTQLDDFTLSLLCNREVNDIDQDPEGIQAYPIKIEGESQMWVKPLEDGSIAIGLFNLSSDSLDLSLSLQRDLSSSDLGIVGPQTVRDLWRQQDLGQLKDSEKMTFKIPSHGCRLLKLYPGNQRE